MIINRHIRPPQGYVFTDSDGVTHTADSWPHLVRVIAQYRALNRKPPGDPAREITAVVCMQNPSLCQSGGTDPLERVDREGFYMRVMGWVVRQIDRIRKKELRHVNAIIARERANICRECPFQNGWEKDCSTCRESARVAHRQVLGGSEDMGRGLLGCLVLSEDTSLSVHLEQPAVKDARLPDKCWRRAK